jgi:hypothetical protein
VIDNVAVYGDSITQGTDGSGLGGNGSWSEQWRDRLAVLSGKPVIGPGLRGLWNSSSLTLGIPDATQEWNTVGTWTHLSTSDVGNKAPHGQMWGGANGSGAVATWLRQKDMKPITSFALYYVDLSSSPAGDFQYQIDGGAWTNIGQTPQNNNALKKLWINSPVNTSIALRQFNGITATGCWPVGVEPYYQDPRFTNRGLIFHNLGRFGFWLQVTTGSLLAGSDPLGWYDSCVLLNGAVDHKPKLSTLEFANDLAVFGNPTQWTTNLTTFWNRVQPMGIPWLLFGLYELSGLDATMQNSYRTNSATLAATTNGQLTVLDIFNIWQNLGLGAVGAQVSKIYGSTSCGFLSDGTHPSQLGNADIADRLLRHTKNNWVRNVLPRPWRLQNGFTVGKDQLGGATLMGGDISQVEQPGQDRFNALFGV